MEDHWESNECVNCGGYGCDECRCENKIEPVKDDYEEILGKSTCDWIDNNFTGYQKQFNFI